MIGMVDKDLTPEERKRIAEKVGVHATSLLQAMKGERNFSIAECVRIERESGYRLRRWDLRPKDWFLNWPELIGKKGAPEVPQSANDESKARA
jgi:DNA-binding transcriptional regulator YdaS (Cro superfamily)